MHQDDGQFCCNGIQVVAIGMPFLSQLGVIIVKADHDPVIPRYGGVVQKIPQSILQILDRVYGPVRRREEVGDNGLGADSGEVAVGIDKARHDYFPIEIDNVGCWAFEGRNLFRRANSDYQAIFGGNGLCQCILIIDGYNRPVSINSVRVVHILLAA